MSDKLCPCGSNEPRESLYDARGIFCCYVCDECKVRKALRYRVEVLEDPNYDCDEEVDEDTALDREFHDAFDKND